LSMVAIAFGLLIRIARDVLRASEVDQKSFAVKSRTLAIASLAAWLGLIAAGRYLAYTYTWEMLGVPAVL